LATALGFLSLLSVAGCTSKQNSAPPLSPLAEQGRKVYMANCIACHNSDPAKDGAVGPAVAGSSLALLHARVVEGGYPPGYKPKRPSQAMAALPHLKNEIEALEAFLKQP
jgi:mono/diheme cytochrome c family protein